MPPYPGNADWSITKSLPWDKRLPTGCPCTAEEYLPTMKRLDLYRQFLWLAACLAMTAGCTSLNLSKPTFWPFGDDKPAKPEKVVAIWTDTVLYQSNQPSVRGFGVR